MRRKPPSSVAETPGTRRLPRPRKQPSQSRSRALVDAVVEACLRILDAEGPQALTVQRIAEVSGATVGSIYQYFPNKDAIVALVYERMLHEEAERVLAEKARVRGLPLIDALREIFANTIRVELRLYRLNGEFHLRYQRDLQLGLHCGPYASSRDYVDSTWLAFLKLYEGEITAPDWEMAAYLLGMGLRAVVCTALEDDTARLEQPAFLDGLVAMALGVLKPGR